LPLAGVTPRSQPPAGVLAPRALARNKISRRDCSLSHGSISKTKNKIPRISITGIFGYGSKHFHKLLEVEKPGKILLVAAKVINPDQESGKRAFLENQGDSLFNG